MVVLGLKPVPKRESAMMDPARLIQTSTHYIRVLPEQARRSGLDVEATIKQFEIPREALSGDTEYVSHPAVRSPHDLARFLVDKTTPDSRAVATWRKLVCKQAAHRKS